MLLGPFVVEDSPLRLFDVALTPTELAKQRCHGAINYLKRGETVNYSASTDSLKGGIPAKRSNIKNRRPNWYCLNVPPVTGPRLIVPEHIDERYVCTLLPEGDDVVVLDKLFIVEPREAEHAPLVHACLNSVLTWAQFEMRGRTQLGQGVLEVKKTDLEGVLVLNPEAIHTNLAEDVLASFAPLLKREILDSEAELAEEDRALFEISILVASQHSDADDAKRTIERCWRAAKEERRTRAHSLDEAREERGRVQRVAPDVDAFALRVAAEMRSFPDPRHFLPIDGFEAQPIAVSGPIEGTLRLGDDLFSHGQVLDAEKVIASAGDVLAAQFVRAVLLRDPEVPTVPVPEPTSLKACLEDWGADVSKWHEELSARLETVCAGMGDERLRKVIRDRSIVLLHAI